MMALLKFCTYACPKLIVLWDKRALYNLRKGQSGIFIVIIFWYFIF